MQKVYIESSIISYLVSKESHDIIILGHQILTKEWWEDSKLDYDCYISLSVIDEISRGNTEFSDKRIQLSKTLKVLEFSDEIKSIVTSIMKKFNLPLRMELDITHIAYSMVYEMDYLLTWNCKHLANAHFKTQLAKYQNDLGLKIPIICTPEELNKKEYENA